MPSVYQLKSRFQDLLRPLCRRLADRGVTANQVTVSAIVLSAAGGLAMVLFPEAAWPWLALPLLLFVRMALNAIDGMLAREHDQKSSLGAILNELGDVVSDILLYLPFALLPFVDAPLVVAICLLAVIGEMTGVIGVQIGASRRYDGPFGKSDRAVLFGGCGLLIGLGVENSTLYLALFSIAALLSAFTIWNRARAALKEIA